jgi:uncharacterized coiled-coil protein SlyX
MTKDRNDDDVIRLIRQSEEVEERLLSMYQRKAEHETALSKLNEAHSEMLRTMNEITEHLNRVTGELRGLNIERAKLTDELRYLARDMKHAAREGRTLRWRIRDAVGRDVCPKCGSTNIATIAYGYPAEDFDDDDFSVIGGCCVEPDETVRCLDCDNNFLGNFEKWRRARIDSFPPETVLEVGADGGTLTIVRKRNEYGDWEFQCLRDETTFSELLPEEFGDGEGLIEKSARMDTFEDALVRLDRYPWYCLFPLKVHPEYADSVLREIEKRGGKEAVAEWIERLKGQRG